MPSGEGVVEGATWANLVVRPLYPKSLLRGYAACLKALLMGFGPPLGLRGAPGEPFLESESQHTPVVAVFPTGVADLILASVAPSTTPSPGRSFLGRSVRILMVKASGKFFPFFEFFVPPL